MARAYRRGVRGLGASRDAVIARIPARQKPSGSFGEVLITFMVVALQLMTPLKALTGYPALMASALASADRIIELLDVPSDEDDAPGVAEAVLRDVDFELRRGQVVAVVGPSGAGKTTLADLLPRFYEPNAGEILLDGVPIGRHTRRSLRALMGTVAQDTILLNDTVPASIAYGRPDVSRERVIEAARIANAHDFIARLPQGYDTRLGERGPTSRAASASASPSPARCCATGRS